MKKTIYLFTFVLFAFFAYGTANLYAKNKKAKYVFYFIGDGMGVNQINGTEMYLAEKEGRIGIVPLIFTQFPVTNIVTTYSSSNSVTCSASAGTALATGEKTKAGTISMDKNHHYALETIAEKAQKARKKVGIATNVSIDHATPAAFYAHQTNRSKAYEIGKDLAKSGFDFFAGSGFMSPTNYTNPEEADLFSIISDSGYVFVRGHEEFNAKYKNKSKIILLPKEGHDQLSLSYAIDYTSDDLTLPQITENAIKFLTKDNKNGFFLMVEGGKIDWACHANDGITAFKDIIDFSEAIQKAYDFYLKHPKETLIVVTADHETGGIILGGTKSYSMNLKVLNNQLCSKEKLTTKIQTLRKNTDNNVSWEQIKGLLSQNLGFWNTIQLTETQEEQLKNEYDKSFVQKEDKMASSLYANDETIVALAIKILNDIALLHWGSNTHTAGYVPLYAIGVNAEIFNGKIDNAEIPQRICRIAGY